MNPKHIYPLIAIAKGKNGERSFATQKQADYLTSNVGNVFSGDVMLGRCIVAYFSPQITQEWVKEMRLVNNTRERDQRMMGAQAPVWVSIPAHAEELLSDGNPIVTTIESYIDSFAVT